MTRIYSLDAYLHRGSTIVITTDASPWAIGGYIMVDGIIREFFHQLVSEEDARILNIPLGSCEAQQGMESFGLLVALRLWRRFWHNRRVILTVRSDSVAGLTVVLKFRSSGEAPSLVARELAIDMARTTYTPQIVEHIPGVANVVADILSRHDVPNRSYDVPNYWDALKATPACLRGATMRVVPPRPRSWWISLSPP